jgi:nitroreductase
MNQMLDALQTRRSVKVAHLGMPAPDAQQLAQMLEIAMRVPDHGKLAPWRIKVFDAQVQAAFGDVCASRFAELHVDANEKQIAFERNRPQRAPLLLAVTSEPVIGKIPLWEQQLSAGAVCMNILHAAGAMGFGAQWLTEWIAFDEVIREAVCESQEGQIAGFIYIGTAEQTPDERARPDYDAVVSNWTAAPTLP